MKTAKELDLWYQTEDPWQYKSSEDDKRRLKQILFTLGWGPRFYLRALDIGCGEGFITQHIPAYEIHGLDISKKAMSRLPGNVKAITKPEGKYDLVLCSDTLYPEYDQDAIYKTIMNTASKYLLISGIDERIPKFEFGKEIFRNAIKYQRQYNQLITLYEID